ncbi:MAG: HDOD domain-containing protein [Candidatus Scalindua sp.]|nr:HDOD domain-containing protein [Candidatus Scalindua sp.]
MSKISLVKLLNKIEELPPLPQSIPQILDITRNPDSSAHDLTKVFERDPTLAAGILKLANTAYYGFNRKISTISHAVVCLGFNTIRSIALTASTHGMLSNGIDAYHLEKGMLWQHSTACAICARMIAQHVKYKDCEEAYIAGLLHDIGKIILSSFAEEQYDEIIEKTMDNKTPYNVAELEVLGYDHPQIGGKIIEKWNLPPALVEAVQYHHQPEKAENNTILTYIVHLADAICDMLGIGLGSDGLMYIFEENTFDILGIGKEDVETFMSELVDKIQSGKLES